MTTVSGEVHTFDANDAEAVIVNQYGNPICRGELVFADGVQLRRRRRLFRGAAADLDA